MKRGLKILSLLVVMTISGFSVIACGQGISRPLPNRIDYLRNEIARLEALKETTNDAAEIAAINEKIDRLAAEWIHDEINYVHPFDFKIELKQKTLWKDILKEMIPNYFSEYFSSHSDLKKYFDISKLRVPSDQPKTYDPVTNRYLISYNYDNYPTDEITLGGLYLEIIGDIIE